MVKALADRFAEAFAEHITCWPGETGTNRTPPRIRTTCWPSGSVVSARPSAIPRARHSPKRILFDLLDAGQFGMTLTESCAMWPAASVSGLLFAHPGARYFTVGRIGRDRPPITPAGKASASAKPNAGCVPTWPTTLSN